MASSSRQMVTMGRLFFLVVAFGAGGLVVFLGQPSDPHAQYHQDTLHAQQRRVHVAVAAPVARAAPHDSLAAKVWPTQPAYRQPLVDQTAELLRQLPYSADCGSKPNTLVIGILASPSPRSGQSRDAIRQTWGRYTAYKSTVTVRFLLALDSAGNVPSHIAREAELHGDIVLLFTPSSHETVPWKYSQLNSETHDLYANLGEKVRLFFKWTVDFCLIDPTNPTYILKTDDDSFIHVSELLSVLKDLPKSSLLYGRMMTKMPGGKNKRGKWDPDNRHFLQTWPTYPSGAAYLITMDVARLFGYPPLPLEHHKNEDRRVGVVLFGFNISYIDAPRFYPWGHCQSDAIMIHYNRRPEMVRRRYERIVKGESVCGQQFSAEQSCSRAAERGKAQFECPKGKRIKKILNATYSRQLGEQEHARYPWCKEGFEGIEIDPECAVDVTEQVTKLCLGKSDCNFMISQQIFSSKDPCPRKQKHFQGVVQCA